MISRANEIFEEQSISHGMKHLFHTLVQPVLLEMVVMLPILGFLNNVSNRLYDMPLVDTPYSAFVPSCTTYE